MARTGNPYSSRSGKKWRVLRLFCFFCGVLSAAYIFAGNFVSSGAESEDQSLRGKSAASALNEKNAGEVQTTPELVTPQEQSDGDDYYDELDVQLEKNFYQATEELYQAEANEVEEAEESIFKKAFAKVEDLFKFTLGKEFGNNKNFTEEDLMIVAEKVSERLEYEVAQKFQEKSDEIKRAKIQDLENVLSENVDAYEETSEIDGDVSDAKVVAIYEMKKEIAHEAEDLSNRMKGIAAEIEKTVIKEVLDTDVEFDGENIVLKDKNDEKVKKTEKKIGKTEKEGTVKDEENNENDPEVDAPNQNAKVDDERVVTPKKDEGGDVDSERLNVKGVATIVERVAEEATVEKEKGEGDSDEEQKENGEGDSDEEQKENGEGDSDEEQTENGEGDSDKEQTENGEGDSDQEQKSPIEELVGGVEENVAIYEKKTIDMEEKLGKGMNVESAIGAANLITDNVSA